MAAPSCSAHPVAATHRCDGCARLLCAECFEVGHRLLFCRHCGERALPLDDQGPANARELTRQRVHLRPYSLRDALRYPLRGQGVYVGAGAVLYLVLLQGLVAASPYAGLGALPLLLSVLLLAVAFAGLAAGLSFAIIRSTAAGSEELPDWPGLSEPGERASEVLAVLVLGLMALLPAITLVHFTNCVVGVLAAEPLCLAVVAVGVLLGLPLWVPSFGAVGLFGNTWLVVRWDLHVRAMLATWPATIRLSLLIGGAQLAAVLLGVILSRLPLLGVVAARVIDVYVWLVTLHLVGLQARRHEGDLELIYYH